MELVTTQKGYQNTNPDRRRYIKNKKKIKKDTICPIVKSKKRINIKIKYI